MIALILSHIVRVKPVTVEYGIKFLAHTSLTVPIVTVNFDNPMEAIRGLLNLMKVYNAGVESGRMEV